MVIYTNFTVRYWYNTTKNNIKYDKIIDNTTTDCYTGVKLNN